MKFEPAEPDPDGVARAVRRCTKSDVAAQYARHHEMLRRVAGSVFGRPRPEVAEDAVMLVFAHLLDLVERGRLIDKGDTWEPYLRRAVRNRCLDILRGEKRHRERFPEGDPNRQRLVDSDPLGDEVAQSDETRRRVAQLPQALASLSNRHATIIKRKFWDQWSDKKIGDTLGITGQAVGQQLRTALKRLHEEVTKSE